MAMIKCSECGHLESDKAHACPSCGVAIASKPSAAKKGLAVIVAFGFGLVAAVVAMTAFIANGYESAAVPGLLAFVVGAAAGWFRVMR